MSYSIQDLQSLRQKTGAGMMDCKRALESANGNMEEAESQLRERGLAVAMKKAERVSADGLAFAEQIGDKAILVEVNCETDFAAKSEGFRRFAEALAQTIARYNPADLDALMECEYGDSKKTTVREALHDKVLMFGENIKIRRFAVVAGGFPVAYLHLNGRIGVILRLEADPALPAEALAPVGRELAMQIAAMAPEYTARGDIPVERLEALRSDILEELRDDPKYRGKPDAIREKILVGRIDKYCREKCLLEQPYIKEETMMVSAYLTACAKEIGGTFAIGEFYRYEKGDGLQNDGEMSNAAFAKAASSSR